MKECFLAFEREEDSVCHKATDDDAMSYKVYKQVRDETEDLSVDNFQRLHEEIAFPLKGNRKDAMKIDAETN